MVDQTDITRAPKYLRAQNFGISYLSQEPSVFRKLISLPSMTTSSPSTTISAATGDLPVFAKH